MLDGSAPRSVALTLVGPSGTRVVEGFARGALEVPAAEGFAVALAGVHPNAEWIALAETDTTLTTVTEKTGKRVTTIAYGGHDLGRFAGTPLGAISSDGTLRLVLVDGAKTTTVDL